MLIILIVLIFMYIGLKVIFAEEKTNSSNQDKIKEVSKKKSIKADGYDEINDITTNTIIYSSIIDTSIHSMPDCSSNDSHNCNS